MHHHAISGKHKIQIHARIQGFQHRNVHPDVLREHFHRFPWFKRVKCPHLFIFILICLGFRFPISCRRDRGRRGSSFDAPQNSTIFCPSPFSVLPSPSRGRTRRKESTRRGVVSYRDRVRRATVRIGSGRRKTRKTRMHARVF